MNGGRSLQDSVLQFCCGKIELTERRDMILLAVVSTIITTGLTKLKTMLMVNKRNRCTSFKKLSDLI